MKKKVKLAVVGCGSTFSAMYGPILKYLDNGKIVNGVYLSSSMKQNVSLPLRNSLNLERIFKDIKEDSIIKIDY